MRIGASSANEFAYISQLVVIRDIRELYQRILSQNLSGTNSSGTTEKNKQHEQPAQPQMYRDVEASGGLGVQSSKTGADSPVNV